MPQKRIQLNALVDTVMKLCVPQKAVEFCDKLDDCQFYKDYTPWSWIISYVFNSSSYLGSTAQLRPWPPPQNPDEFLGGFSTIFFFTG
jgi:hypothetical protein